MFLVTTAQFKIIESLHPPFHTNHVQSCPQQFKGKNWPQKSIGAYPSLESVKGTQSRLHLMHQISVPHQWPLQKQPKSQVFFSLMSPSDRVDINNMPVSVL